MIDLNENEVDQVSGAGPWSLISKVAAVYEAASEFGKGFWEGAKEGFGIK
jgi:hypothetical protein